MENACRNAGCFHDEAIRHARLFTYLSRVYSLCINIGGGPFRRHRFGAGQLGAGHFGAVYYFFLFSSYAEKNNEAGNFLNAVEREPVGTRVLNPTASEASYKPKQRSYRKTNLKKKVLAPDSPGAEMSRERRRNVPDPTYNVVTPVSRVQFQNISVHMWNP